MAIAPPLQVDPPIRTPLPYGLFSVLTFPPEEGSPYWQNGIEWEGLNCEPAGGRGAPGCEADGPGGGEDGGFGDEGFGEDDFGDPAAAAVALAIGLPKTLVRGTSGGSAAPFTVYGSYTCSAVGSSAGDAPQRAVDHLLAREEARTEQAIWTGDLGTGSLRDEAVSAGTGLNGRTAVARLEQQLGVEYGSLGVLHMSRAAAVLLLAQDVLEVRGGRLYTVLGTPVVAGAGYPDGEIIIASGALVGRRSPVFAAVDGPGAGFDRANNDVMAVAERTYVIGWDPCMTPASVTIDMTA